MTMTMAQFTALYDPDIQGLIKDRSMVTPIADRIVNSGPATEYVTNIVGMTGLGLTQTREEGVAVDYTDPVQGYAKAYTQVLFGMGVKFTERLWSYNKFPEAMAAARDLGDSAAYSRELAVVNLLNNGFDSGYAGADGKELFSLIHPLKNVPGGTEQNELTTTGTALSDTSLNEALYTAAITVNHSGLKRQPMMKYLVVPPQLERTALILTQATEMGRPSTGNNDKNFLHSQLEVISTPLLSSTTAWFLLTDKSGHDLKRLVHREPSVRGAEQDFDSQIIKYAIAYEEVLGHGEWFGTFGAEGA